MQLLEAVVGLVVLPAQVCPAVVLVQQVASVVERLLLVPKVGSVLWIIVVGRPIEHEILLLVIAQDEIAVVPARKIINSELGNIIEKLYLHPRQPSVYSYSSFTAYLN